MYANHILNFKEKRTGEKMETSAEETKIQALCRAARTACADGCEIRTLQDKWQATLPVHGD